jgi:hypothetical protein
MLWLMTSISGMFWLTKTQKKHHPCQEDGHVLAQPLAERKRQRLWAASEEDKDRARKSLVIVGRTTH